MSKNTQKLTNLLCQPTSFVNILYVQRFLNAQTTKQPSVTSNKFSLGRWALSKNSISAKKFPYRKQPLWLSSSATVLPEFYENTKQMKETEGW